MTTTLDALLESVLHEEAFVTSMRRAVASFASYRDALPVLPQAYTRTLLHKSDAFEIVAMVWAPQSVSAIHDHGDSRCWVAMLEGELDVENYERLDDRRGRYARLRLASRDAVRSGDVDHRLNWRELHRVRNLRESSAVSLQLYAAPLSLYTIVDPGNGSASIATATYDKTILL